MNKLTAALNLIGKKFNRLTVVSRAESKYQKAQWNCVCDCGKTLERTLSSSEILSGHTKSCGCLQHEYAVRLGKSKAVHKMGQTRIYRIWSGMKQRCYYPKAIGYKNYGGRGITVCQEWKDDFMSFYSWAIHRGIST